METEDYLKVGLVLVMLVLVVPTGAVLLNTFGQSLFVQTQWNMLHVEWSFDGGETWQTTADNETVDVTMHYDRLVPGKTYHPYMRVTNVGDINVTLKILVNDAHRIFYEKTWNYNGAILDSGKTIGAVWTLTVNEHAYNQEGTIQISVTAHPANQTGGLP